MCGCAAGDAQATRALFLHVGLQDGTLMRSDVDPATGALSDVRKRYLGTRPPVLLPCAVSGAQGMFALTSRAWLAYNWQVRLSGRALAPTRAAAWPAGPLHARMPWSVPTGVHTAASPCVEHILLQRHAADRPAEHSTPHAAPLSS